jgi:hypothetical protein
MEQDRPVGNSFPVYASWNWRWTVRQPFLITARQTHQWVANEHESSTSGNCEAWWIRLAKFSLSSDSDKLQQMRRLFAQRVHERIGRTAQCDAILDLLSIQLPKSHWLDRNEADKL